MLRETGSLLALVISEVFKFCKRNRLLKLTTIVENKNQLEPLKFTTAQVEIALVF